MSEPNAAQEHWLAVPGYLGLYEVSDLGRVRSVDRVVSHSGGPLHLKGKVLAQALSKRHCRWTVKLSVQGRTRTKEVQVLVLSAFRGERPPSMECCHNDGNSKNNRLDNLRWDTCSENGLDRVRHGTHPAVNRTHCPRNHRLTSPNLRTARLPHRDCLACHRTYGNQQTARKYGRLFDFAAEADRQYERIMAGLAPDKSRSRAVA